ncbi:MAG TPA: hypothetical protein VGN34_02700 [Ktedonobacteraceae bacterium]|jgi:hypothetical protein
MALGAGKYDDLCSIVLEQSGAEAAIVIILGGNKGSGFSLQAPLEIVAHLPDILEFMAMQLREDAKPSQLQ